MSAQQGKILFVNSVTAYWLVTTVRYVHGQVQQSLHCALYFMSAQQGKMLFVNSVTAYWLVQVTTWASSAIITLCTIFHMCTSRKVLLCLSWWIYQVLHFCSFLLIQRRETLLRERLSGRIWSYLCRMQWVHYRQGFAGLFSNSPHQILKHLL